MTRVISTRVHGVLDYTSVPTLLAVPRIMGWNERATRAFTFSALGALVYSLLTRYELGPIKILPMKVHLFFDGTSGAALCGVAMTMQDDDPVATRALIAFGLFEIAASRLTKTR